MGSSTDSSANSVPKVLYKAYDYMVYYNIDGKPEIDPYYEYFLSEEKRLDSDKEKPNKGYIFSFATPIAGYAGKDGERDSNYYSEKFTWQTFGDDGFNIYDTAERKKKPDSIKIFMLNTNKAIGWQEIAEINPETLKATANTEICQKYDLAIDTTDAYSITVAPNGIKNNGATNTDGLLKVLRDAKHYYKIEGSRKDGDTSIYAKVGEDGSIFAYRQITDEELVKSTMLVIADAFNKTSQGSTTNGATGSFWWGSEYNWVPSFYKLKMKINNYTHIWNKLPNNNLTTTSIPAFIKILAPNNSNDPMGSAWNKKPYFLCTGGNKDFNISGLISLTIENNKIPLSSYSGIIKFAAEKNTFTAEVWQNNTKEYGTGKISPANEVMKWIPADIDENGYQGQNPKFGWWED